MYSRYFIGLIILAKTGLGAVVSPNGSCGPANGNTCLGSAYGNCCSRYGWCGSTSDYCAAGCQPGFGACNSSPPPAPSLTLVATKYPSLIIPIEQDHPTTALNTQYSGHIARQGGAHEVATEIKFDVSSANGATTCKLDFKLANFQPLSWSGTAPYKFTIFALNGQVEQSDTWNSHPTQGSSVATVEIINAANATITANTVSCYFGTTQSFLLRAEAGRDLDFKWFEAANPTQGIIYQMWK